MCGRVPLPVLRMLGQIDIGSLFVYSGAASAPDHISTTDTRGTRGNSAAGELRKPGAVEQKRLEMNRNNQKKIWKMASHCGGRRFESDQVHHEEASTVSWLLKPGFFLSNHSLKIRHGRYELPCRFLMLWG